MRDSRPLQTPKPLAPPVGLPESGNPTSPAINRNTRKGINMTVTVFTEIDVPLECWPAERLTNCWYCGHKLANTRGFTVETAHGSNRVSVPSGYARLAREHQLPRSRGGNAGSNIVPACDSCNERKSTKTVEEYRTYLFVSGDPVVFYGELPNG